MQLKSLALLTLTTTAMASSITMNAESHFVTLERRYLGGATTLARSMVDSMSSLLPSSLAPLGFGDIPGKAEKPSETLTGEANMGTGAPCSDEGVRPNSDRVNGKSAPCSMSGSSNSTSAPTTSGNDNSIPTTTPTTLSGASGNTTDATGKKGDSNDSGNYGSGNGNGGSGSGNGVVGDGNGDSGSDNGNSGDASSIGDSVNLV